MIFNYWNFLTRPLTKVPVPIALETVPQIYFHTMLFAAGFSIIMILVPQLSKSFYPKWYSGLSDRKKSEFPTYLISLIHHFLAVPIAWIYIYKDFLVTDYDNPLDYSAVLPFIAPLCVGFVVADTFFYAIPLSFTGNIEYLIHHGLALWLCSVFLTGPGNLTRFYPHILICDTTNIFFNIAWLLRLVGYKDTPIVTVLEILFSVFFALIRCVNLTIVFGVIFFSDEGRSFGVGRFVFPLISALQFYWLVKIIQSLAGKFGKKTTLPSLTGEKGIKTN